MSSFVKFPINILSFPPFHLTSPISSSKQAQSLNPCWYAILMQQIPCDMYAHTKPSTICISSSENPCPFTCAETLSISFCVSIYATSPERMLSNLSPVARPVKTSKILLPSICNPHFPSAFRFPTLQSPATFASRYEATSSATWESSNKTFTTFSKS